MTADYNGWNDLPEAEREALNEADEHTASPARTRKPSRIDSDAGRALYREARSPLK